MGSYRNANVEKFDRAVSRAGKYLGLGVELRGSSRSINGAHPVFVDGEYVRVCGHYVRAPMSLEGWHVNSSLLHPLETISALFRIE